MAPLPPAPPPVKQPATPCCAAERANPLAPERTATASSTGSWSLWDAGSSGSASSFYEELQAAALGLGPPAATLPTSSLLPGSRLQAGPRQLLHSNSWPQSHSQAERTSLAALQQHRQAMPPHALASAAAQHPLGAPFPGLGRSASGLAQPLGSYDMPTLHSMVSSLAASHPVGPPAGAPLSASHQHYPSLMAEPPAAAMPPAAMPSVVEREMQQLLVALASMAALE